MKSDFFRRQEMKLKPAEVLEIGPELCIVAAMNPDSSELRSRAIETTMAQFDFAKVAIAAAAVGWNLNTRPHQAGGVPIPDEMRRIARELLEKAWDDEEAQNCEHCHGGLRASRTDGCLSLQFVIEEAYFVAALDLAPEGRE